MGLMLSVLVFSIGVIEALSAFDHMRTGYLPLEFRRRGRRRTLVAVKRSSVDIAWPGDLPRGEHVIKRRSGYASCNNSVDLPEPPPIPQMLAEELFEKLSERAAHSISDVVIEEEISEPSSISENISRPEERDDVDLILPDVNETPFVDQKCQLSENSSTESFIEDKLHADQTEPHDPKEISGITHSQKVLTDYQAIPSNTLSSHASSDLSRSSDVQDSTKIDIAPKNVNTFHEVNESALMPSNYSEELIPSNDTIIAESKQVNQLDDTVQLSNISDSDKITNPDQESESFDLTEGAKSEVIVNESKLSSSNSMELGSLSNSEIQNTTTEVFASKQVLNDEVTEETSVTRESVNERVVDATEPVVDQAVANEKYLDREPSGEHFPASKPVEEQHSILKSHSDDSPCTPPAESSNVYERRMSSRRSSDLTGKPVKHVSFNEEDLETHQTSGKVLHSPPPTPPPMPIFDDDFEDSPLAAALLKVPTPPPLDGEPVETSELCSNGIDESPFQICESSAREDEVVAEVTPESSSAEDDGNDEMEGLSHFETEYTCIEDDKLEVSEIERDCLETEGDSLVSLETAIIETSLKFDKEAHGLLEEGTETDQGPVEKEELEPKAVDIVENLQKEVEADKPEPDRVKVLKDVAKEESLTFVSQDSSDSLLKDDELGVEEEYEEEEEDIEVEYEVLDEEQVKESTTAADQTSTDVLSEKVATKEVDTEVSVSSKEGSVPETTETTSEPKIAGNPAVEDAPTTEKNQPPAEEKRAAFRNDGSQMKQEMKTMKASFDVDEEGNVVNVDEMARTVTPPEDVTSPDKAFWLIFSGEYTKAMSKDWHSGHFCCWQCDESLTGQRYVLRDDHPYCIKCYESVFANACDECNKTIGIDSKDLSYKDKHWHEACFLCSKCRVSLVDKQFGSKADKIYCGNCYDAQFASRCDGCGQIFRAGTKKMEYKTRQWHEQCFCCCVCKTPIGTKSFIPREQEIYCAGCYEEKFATRCVKCNKIITSGGVTYKNEPWHRECFTCTNCNTSLAGQRFTSRDEKPYCADCFGELFAKRCTSCSKPITGIGGTRFISFEDRHWHNDCFICASCKTSLVGKGFITADEDILCTECAKQKIM